MPNVQQARRKSGFTLIELLVVISIIGLLSTLAVVALNNARIKSRDAKRVADAQQLMTAMALYFDTYNTYDFPAGATNNCGNAALAVNVCTGTGNLGLADFMGGIGTISDPLSTSTLCTGANAAPCLPAFTAAAGAAAYTIGFATEGSTGTLTAGGHTITERGIID